MVEANANQPDPRDVDSLLAFHDAFLRDRAAGRDLGLLHYLLRAPGHELAIAREYLRMVDVGRGNPEVGRDRELFAGRFRIESVLGKGGQAEVLLAHDERFDRRVALKCFARENSSGSPSTRVRYEAKVAAKLAHPRICRILEEGIDDSRPYLVMEYIEGRTLREFLAERAAPFPPRSKSELMQVVRFFREAAAAVQVAHLAGIIHRDLKPANIMVRPDITPVLLDFGLARSDHDRIHATRTGDRVGTPGYMAPEQIRGEVKKVDAHADVFSLGIVFCECLTGRHPFEAATDAQREKRVLEGTPSLVRNLNPAVPWQLAAIIDTCIKDDIARRYRDAGALTRDLDAFLADRPIAASRVGWMRRVHLFARRHRNAVAWSIATLLIGVLLVVALDRTRFAGHARLKLDFVDLERVADELVQKGDSNWPRDAAGIEGLAAWCADAQRLVDELPRLERRVETLRGTDLLPIDAGAEAIEGERLRRRAFELEERTREFERDSQAYLPWPDDDDRPFSPGARLALLRTRLAEESAELSVLRNSARLRFTFRDSAAQEEHDRLVSLVEKLRSLACDEPSSRSLPFAQRKLAWYRALVKRCEEFDRDLWRGAIATIKDVSICPQYRGLEIVPQFGLRPMGRNANSGLYEFLFLPSGTQPTVSGTGEFRIERDSGVVFVLVPGGSFAMGSEAEDAVSEDFAAEWSEYERPVTEITLAPFFAAKCETTREQWYSWTGRSPARDRTDQAPSRDGERAEPALPVTTITWREARAVATAHGLELPTEAQWEYFARAGTTTRFPTGDDWRSLGFAANLANGSTANGADSERRRRGSFWEDSYVVTARVGGMSPNRFGLQEVIGNVAEFCRDGFAAYGNPVTDPEGTRSTVGNQVVYRGASYRSGLGQARSSWRGGISRDVQSETIGIRLVRSLREPR